MSEPQPMATNTGPLGRLDAWMAQHPWHPRVMPFVVYVLMLPAIHQARLWWPPSYPLLYIVQCGLVGGLLWRYRGLMPELSWRFHWLAIPVGAGVMIAWVALGYGTTCVWPALSSAEEHTPFFTTLEPAALRWTALGLRLLGMSLLVPMFEELVMRSLLLRSFRYFRRTATAVFQLAEEIPILGDWLLHTPLAKRADHHQHPLKYQFETNPLGVLSVFGVAASTFVFMIHHVPRDWAGCVVCGVAYCLLLAATCKRKADLGPVIWAHGITNALLWGYVLFTGDWQFL
ncbi:MAG: CPBP family intramembrane metalloprotease [Phycisphaeraceae bacterium]|nr:CPBP family intramembrane metalloprotease [Phycisphaeraceae bacterium]